MTDPALDKLKGLRVNKIIYPIVIGIGVIIYMLYSEIKHIDDIEISPIDTIIKTTEWKEFTHDDAKQKYQLQINDTSLSKSKNLRFLLRYHIENSYGEIEQITDTVAFDAFKTNANTNSKYIENAERIANNQINFEFKQSVRSVFSPLDFNWMSLFWLLMAFLMMVIRDFGYMLRLRILTGNELSWSKCFDIIMLWEFSSALTPSAIGGSGIAIFLVNKEGLNVGRSTAVVMSSIFLDEFYFLMMVPLVFIMVSGTALFSVGGAAFTGEALSFTNEFFLFAVVSYIIIFVFTIFLAYGLFGNPRGLKMLLLWIFKLPFLRRWRAGANQTGTDLIISSRELRSKSFGFWLKAFGATIFSWTGRYWIVNILLIGLIGALTGNASYLDHFLIFARQLVMWIMMIISPTPGGSGFAEFVFSNYLGEFIPVGFAVAMALLWRIISYYPYLFFGAILLPRWLRKKFISQRKK